MISYISQEDIVYHWKTIKEYLGKFWGVGVNLETLDNLKKRLLAEECRLWLWSDPEIGKLLFITEIHYTAKAKLLTVTHTAGVKATDTRFTKSKLEAALTKAFEEIEDMARTLYCDGVKIFARPAHVKLAKGYTKMSTPIIKLF